MFVVGTRCQHSQGAGHSFEHIAINDDLNLVQLRSKLAVTKEKVNSLKVQVRRFTYSKLKEINQKVHSSEFLTSARERLSDFTELFQFLCNNSVPALHRVLANAGKDGWGTKELLTQCRLAAEGKYVAENYSQYEINLSILLYELGGGGAVYAMNHSIFALPSRNTIQLYRRQHKLAPSVNGLRFTDISSNISALFGPRARRDAKKSYAVSPVPVPVATLHLHTLSFDELAPEPSPSAKLITCPKRTKWEVSVTSNSAHWRQSKLEKIHSLWRLRRPQ